jgi:NTP pyrophosphatase (non-canonical NTP hydrolase)
MISPADYLNEFHEWLGQPFGTGWDAKLRTRLHIEEHAELIAALGRDDTVAIARELADVVYVAYGTAHTRGIPLDLVLAEIHRANMSKFPPDGPELRYDGKLLKGPHYRAPNIGAVLADDRRRQEARRP